MSAQAANGYAAPGNTSGCIVEVSVTDVHGEPVTGLPATAFRAQMVWEHNLGPGETPKKSVTAEHADLGGKVPGTYVLALHPPEGNSWNHGTYFFTIAVVTGAPPPTKGTRPPVSTADSKVAKGQVVTSIKIPAPG